jgi:hypothetical protein
VSTLAKIGFCELALGAVLGWGVVARLERPELLTRGLVAVAVAIVALGR